MKRMANVMPARMTAKKHAPMKHKHKFRSTRIEAAHNGGFTVTHTPHREGMDYSDRDQTHAFADAGAMHDHLKSVYPDNEQAEPANMREEGEQE
jgi:hypothetical protein